MTRPADILMAAHLAKLAAAERVSAEYVERNNDVQHYADAQATLAAAEAQRASMSAAAMMDEICEASTPTGYHSPDMVTVDNGADKPALILCGYHELRRLMRQGTAERAQRVTAGSFGPDGWAAFTPV